MGGGGADPEVDLAAHGGAGFPGRGVRREVRGRGRRHPDDHGPLRGDGALALRLPRHGRGRTHRHGLPASVLDGQRGAQGEIPARHLPGPGPVLHRGDGGGREGVGCYEVMRVLQRERLVAGLHAVAGCARALEDTIAYVQERHAFDGPLSEKQVIRHKVADLATLIEAGRWLTYAACLKFGAGEDVVKEISMVKLFTADMAQKVAYDCVQLHGGYGYMREYPVERFFRDMRLMTIGGGTSEIMTEIIAKQMELYLRDPPRPGS